MIVKQDCRPSVYPEHGRIVIRKSSFGLPLRSLVAGILGEPPMGPPPAVEEAAHQGTHLERPVKDLLPFQVLDDQRETELVYQIGGRIWVLRGHTDGRRDSRTVLEVKTLTDEALIEWRVKRWAAKPNWAWQVSTYCEALGCDRVLMALFARDTGEIDLWESAPPFNGFEIVDRLSVIADWVDRRELPPRERFSGWDPWAHVHRPEAEHDDELGEALAEFDRLKHAVDEKRLAELKERILFLMGDRERVVARGVESTRSEVVSERFDSAALKRDLPDLYAKYLRKSTSTRLVVRRIA